jgi:hypothetical protein
MKTCGVVDVQINVFLASALAEGERAVSHLGHFTPGERAPSTHHIFKESHLVASTPTEYQSLANNADIFDSIYILSGCSYSSIHHLNYLLLQSIPGSFLKALAQWTHRHKYSLLHSAYAS